MKLQKFIRKEPMTLVILVCALVQLVLEFMVHRTIGFMKDDLWYATNLVTGEPLANLADIWDSQVWHYFNWGGRSVNHGLLQLILMGGELFADILNVVVTLTLSYLMCELADKRKILYFCAAFIMMLGLNSAASLSMFWQSGAVNYVYCTNWILLFLIVYLRKVKNPDAKELKGTAFWMIPLGLITGWSNENMGPACFVAAVLVILYFIKYLRRKPPVWMWIGMLTSLFGSILLIIAPGNFVRSATATQASVVKKIFDRLIMMMTAGADYLFPTIVFLLVFMMLYLKGKNKLQAYQIILLITVVLAFGAMILSPVFPGRAAFGIMILCIVLMLSFVREDKAFYAFIICMWLFNLYLLRLELLIPLT